MTDQAASVFEYECPGCTKRLRAQAADALKRVTCPRCGMRHFPAPTSSGGPKADPRRLSLRDLQEDLAVRGAASRSSPITFACVHCGASNQATVAARGGTVLCRKCGESSSVPATEPASRGRGADGETETILVESSDSTPPANSRDVPPRRAAETEEHGQREAGVRESTEHVRRKAAEQARLAALEAERKQREDEERTAREAAEQARLAADSQDRVRCEAAEQARLAVLEAERKQREAEERMAREAAEQARLAAETQEGVRREAAEQARVAALEAERKQREADERLAREAAEQARLAAETQERVRREAAEQARLAALEAERKQREDEERMARETAEQARLAEETQERVRREAAEQARLAAREAERKQREADERMAREAAEQARLAAESPEGDQREADDRPAREAAVPAGSDAASSSRSDAQGRAASERRWRSLNIQIADACVMIPLDGGAESEVFRRMLGAALEQLRIEHALWSDRWDGVRSGTTVRSRLGAATGVILDARLPRPVLGEKVALGVYRANGFRFLGLPADSDNTSVVRAIGEAADGRVRPSWRLAIGIGYCEPQFDPALAADAVDRLRRPSSRLVAEIFWPHLGDLWWDAVRASGTICGPEPARQLVESHGGTPPWRDIRALHALAIVLHNAAFRREAAFANGHIPAPGESWRAANACWKTLLADERFWEHVSRRITALGIHGADALAALRRDLPNAIAGIHASFAGAYAKAGETPSFHRHLALADSFAARAPEVGRRLASTVATSYW